MRHHGSLETDFEAPLPFMSRLQRETLLKNLFQDSYTMSFHYEPAPTMLPLYYLFQALGNWTSKGRDPTIDALPSCYWNHNFYLYQLAYTNLFLAKAFPNLQKLTSRICVGLFNPQSEWPESIPGQMREFLA